MADVFSREKRSDIMSRIRSKNTGIEKLVFSYLRKNKIYFQKHYDKVKGRPDIAVPSKKLAVFIDGDFWHGYRFEKLQGRIPKEYWREKILANMARDKKNRVVLRRDGWQLLRVWEHQLKKSTERTLEKIKDFLIKTPS
ncbi:very short patch repair endonuclease [Candidatus Falkowbacteria bacterium]|nr:very short patch repair endonuclease [Candidatus Falkowbacteria bacterium]